jgi:HAD superfamily phosphatase
MTLPVLIFDMDGVLVDVSESYRESIARTVQHFTGREIACEQIQDFKNQGGWNDDWRLSHHIIAKAGVEVDFETVKAHFQRIFLGDGAGDSGAASAGLILRERWIARPGLFERLGARFRLALFTGRPRADADLTLDRFARGIVFDPIVAMHDVANLKPAPDGLLLIAGAAPGVPLYYVGDTVDDARAARAARVPFVGIAAPSNPRYIDLVFLFQAEGAYAIVDDINFLEEVL